MSDFQTEMNRVVRVSWRRSPSSPARCHRHARERARREWSKRPAASARRRELRSRRPSARRTRREAHLGGPRAAGATTSHTFVLKQPGPAHRADQQAARHHDQGPRAADPQDDRGRLDQDQGQEALDDVLRGEQEEVQEGLIDARHDPAPPAAPGRRAAVDDRLSGEGRRALAADDLADLRRSGPHRARAR